MIEQWKSRKGKFDNTHKKLKKILKHSDRKVNRLADQVHQEVFSDMSCLDCGNCCKTMPAMINKWDVKRISKHLGMSESAFEKKYCRIDEDDDRVWKKTPCTFLGKDNKCSIYEVRPKACREYPNTDLNSFAFNEDAHEQNIESCPAVYHVINRMERALKK